MFGFIGLFVPFVYVTERAIEMGIKDTDAAFLLSVIGRKTSYSIFKNDYMLPNCLEIPLLEKARG